MALGDALAIALMEMNDFKANDFAKFHPGGSLGKNLISKVDDFLSSQKPQVTENDTVKDVIISISGSRHGITVVTNNDEIIGVITDGDLRRMLIKVMILLKFWLKILCLHIRRPLKETLWLKKP
jgi:arabinose-5-phosphate isomerase